MMNPKVDFYFNNNNKWQKEIEQLRIITLDSGLSEELKWGCPCYTLDKKNIVLIHVFKEYCALLFFKGVLLKDTKKILIQQTENVQTARQMRFTNIKEIIKLELSIKSYIKEAIELEKSGKKIELKKTQVYPIPEELKKKFTEDPILKKAFNSLTPGRQRGYLLYFSDAKQSKTREARIDKSIKNIIDGKGINN